VKTAISLQPGLRAAAESVPGMLEEPPVANGRPGVELLSVLHCGQKRFRFPLATKHIVEHHDFVISDSDPQQ